MATIYDAQHKEIGVCGNRGRRKKEDGGGGGGGAGRILPILLARFDFPQLFNVFVDMKPHEDVNFDLFLYRVQPQLPSSGESSYSINVSGGHASIGDHSVTNVGTATPR